MATVANDGYYLRYLQQGEHTGTQWGAPIHIHAEGLAADELDLADLLLPAVKIDVREQCAGAKATPTGATSILTPASGKTRFGPGRC
ncbi:cyclase family protein [Nocardia sp. CA-119907]|uniref:cyclase family protein n=1 Tax=Nocardia sp. CA-119907 TaxID=3239973 RepID=UPI003D961FA6